MTDATGRGGTAGTMIGHASSGADPAPAPKELQERVQAAWAATLAGDERPDHTIKGRHPAAPRPAAPDAFAATAAPAPAAPAPAAPPSPSAPVTAAPRPTSVTVAPEAAHLRPMPPGAPVAAATPRPGGGLVAGEFNVVRIIGKGGMGVVYAARQTSLLRDVALKMIIPGAGDAADAVQRFVHEALVTGDLDHPNIVPVHDLGQDPAGNLYLSMKLVHGTPWNRLLHPDPDRAAAARAASLSLRDHLEIFLKVCDAVAFAHSRGIVHRDLKPENVMVGGFGEVLLMDWGIAVDVSDAPDAVTKAERRRDVRGPAGTPCYMAPELALGDAARIGPRSDVYLLGAILYELLTGGAPHQGTSVHAVLLKAAVGAIELPEQRAPDRTIPRELSRIAVQALAPFPEARYPDVAALEEAVRAYLAHEESLRLAEEALARLEALERPGEVPRERRYAEFADALAGFAQARHLWDGNERAAAGQARAAQSYADEALARGDVGVAAAQLPLLRDNPHADPPRRDALAAAVRRRTASRLRAGLTAAAVVALLVVLYVLRGQWQAADTRREAHEQQRREVAQELVKGWDEAAAGKLADVRARRLALAKRELPATSGSPAAIESLAWAEEVLLWSRGQWSELLRSVTASGQWTNRPAEAARLLAARPEVAASPLAPRLAGAEQKETEPGAGLWPILMEAADTAVAPSVLRAAVEVLEQTSGPTDPAAPHAAARAALRRAAVYGQAAGAARDRGDAVAAVALREAGVPFLLAAPPLGPAAAAPAAPARLRLDRDQTWVAREPATGAERWRSLPMAESGAVSTAVPVADGSAVVAARTTVVRLDGATGDVGARLITGGVVRLMWPDPLDRTRLVVLLEADSTQGLSEEIAVQGGRPSQPPYRTETTLFSGTQSGAAEVRKRLGAAAAKELGLTFARGHDPSTDARVKPRLVPGLQAARLRDRHNPDLLLALLEAGETTLPAAERGALAAEAVAAARGWIPWHAVRVAVKLERLGFRREADALYDAAADTFVAQGGNSDAAPALIGTPATFMRSLGRELFDRGDQTRAVELLEKSRRFSRYLEGDHGLYRRWDATLRAEGKVADAEKLAPRIAESEGPGGVFLLPARFIVGVDMVLVLVLVSPLLLALVVWRLWRRPQATRRADLYARGLRTRGERFLAFFTTPVDRLACTFLSYATRGERAVMALLTVGFLAAAGYVFGAITTIGEVARLPLSLGSGEPAAPVFRHVLEERIRDGRAGPGTFRLLAEARYVRGDRTGAALALGAAAARVPGDPLCANNRAVLDAEAGRADAARAGWARAAAGPGDGALVARYNLARAAGGAPLDAARAALPERDRPHAARLGPGRPLWARAPFDDLQRTIEGYGSVGERSLRAVLGLLGGRLGGFAGLIMGVQGEGVSSTGPGRHLLDGIGVFFIFFGLVALFWLPLPVRPLAPAPAARRLFGRIRHFVTTGIGLFVPGWYELMRGRAPLGALYLAVTLLAWSARATVVRGGILGLVSAPGTSKGYFPLATPAIFYPELGWLATAATVALVVLFAANVPLTVWRAVQQGLLRRREP